jgi:DNA-binding SARP family transcriptional activator
VSTGHWPRPSARRLCQLLFISPGRRVSREAACDFLFPSLAVDRAAHALYKSQSMARLALGGLGPKAKSLLCADRDQLWLASHVTLMVDLEAHEQALRAALTASPGLGRDSELLVALTTGATSARG